MTVADHDAPMLPDHDGETPETAWDTGFRHALTGEPFGSRVIPTVYRKSYARGFVRGCVARARTDAQEAS